MDKNFKKLVLASLAILIALQIWQTFSLNVSNSLVNDLSARLVQVEIERDELKLKLQAAEKLSQVDSSELMADLKFAACMTALVGEGVIITLHDSDKAAKLGENENAYIIHDDDLLRVVNELRAAGAEAVSINGQRLTALSEIRCAGPTLSVNNVRSSAPFEICAIGDKKTLNNAITMRGGIVDTLAVWKIKVEVETSDEIIIPPYEGVVPKSYARIK